MPEHEKSKAEAQTLARAASIGCAATSFGSSNSLAQESLRRQEGIDLDCDPTGEDDLAESLTRDALYATTFEEKDFEPSTGLGRFDASFDPSAGSLDIELRLAFDFTLPEGASFTERAVAAWTGETGWTPSEEEEFIAKYTRVVESTWSGAHTIRCVRPGWEGLVATPRLHLRIVDSGAGNPHFVVAVHGEPAGGRLQRDEQRPSVRDPGPLGGPGTAEMDHDDVESHPLGNNVVHAEEARVDALLPKPGIRVETRGDQARLGSGELARLETVAKGLALSEKHPSGPQFSLEPVGWAQASDTGQFEPSALATAAVGEAFSHLAPGRSGRPMEWGDSESERGIVTLRIPESERANAKLPEFSYAAHETGHMLGLEDEYRGEPGEEHASSLAPLADQAGASSPWRGVDTSSMMSQGKDILPAHYATFWEVLTRMTAGYLRPSDWKVGR
ncbi:MAG: hypothetical protein V4850_33070 [Myxococcota bacterium]